MRIDNPSKIEFFRQQLMHWHEVENFRIFPWVEESDPYKIWISEIMLQQTRAAQAEPYYLNFMEAFPDLYSLARAPLEEVLLKWEGLGYYSRCRNIHFTAQDIVHNRQGVFPKTYQDLLTLKGVGPYTAAAIASFAYGLPHAVVDGNVYRVLSRFYGLEWDIAIGKDQKKFSNLAHQLLNIDAPNLYNQAIMDFGATICTPQRALCEKCPLSSECIAFQGDEVSLFPINSKKIKVTHRYFNYAVLKVNSLIYLQQRQTSDIWQGLFEFYLEESTEKVNDMIMDKDWKVISHDKVWEQQQRLTHRWINAQFYLIELEEIPEALSFGNWVEYADLNNYPFPKTISDFLKNNDF